MPAVTRSYTDLLPSCHPVCRRPGCLAVPVDPPPENEGDHDYCEEHLWQVRALRAGLMTRASRRSELHWPVAARR